MKAKIILPLLLAACTRQGVLYHEMRPLSEDGWRRQDTVTFDIDSTMAGRDTRLCLRIDHTFAYDTLWLRVGRDTVPVPTSALHGKDLLQGELPISPARPGTLPIIHLMRREPLSGVREVGIRCVSPQGEVNR